MAREGMLMAAIDEIYEASIIGEWKQILRLVLDLTGSTAGAYLGLNKSPASLAFCEFLDIPEKMVQDYETVFSVQCPRIRYAVENPGLEVLFDAQHMSHSSDWKTEYFDWLGSHRFRYYLSLRLIDDPNFMCHCSIQRQASDGPVTDQQLRTAEVLLPHLQRGLRLNRLLAASQVVPRSALEVLEARLDATLFCDADGLIVWRNTSAERCLTEAGGHLMEVGGKVMIRDLSRQAAWRLWLANAARSAIDPFFQLQSHFPLTTSPDLVRQFAVIHPLAMGFNIFPDNQSTKFVISLSSVTLETPGMLGSLRDLFNLTPRESELAVCLMAGQTLKETACSMNITLHTVRSYLKAVMFKTDTCRQSELVKLLMMMNVQA